MTNNTAVTVGQAVGVRSGYASREVSFGWTVVHVTPKGKVTARRDSDNYEMKFDESGYEISKFTSRYRSTLVTDLTAAAEENRQTKARIAAAAAIEAVRVDCRGTYDKETMQHIVTDLEAKLAAAKAAVEAI